MVGPLLGRPKVPRENNLRGGCFHHWLRAWDFQVANGFSSDSFWPPTDLNPNVQGVTLESLVSIKRLKDATVSLPCSHSRAGRKSAAVSKT